MLGLERGSKYDKCQQGWGVEAILLCCQSRVGGEEALSSATGCHSPCHQPWRRAGLPGGSHKPCCAPVAQHGSHWEVAHFIPEPQVLPACPPWGTTASLICLHPKRELQGLMPRLGGELGFPHSDLLLLEVLDLRGQAVVAGLLLAADVGMPQPAPYLPGSSRGELTLV